MAMARETSDDNKGDDGRSLAVARRLLCSVLFTDIRLVVAGVVARAAG